MLKTHSLTVSLIVTLCLNWTGVVTATELVKFLGPDTDFGAVLGEAAAVAQDASQLGISSSIALEDYSGEFMIDVSDEGVQVAVLSDDGVSVHVTDLGDIDNPLESEPVSLPGLAHFGEGQDLPRLDQSLKLIPGTLTANHRYRYQWQYRNTFQTGPADINGMKVFVFGGEAQLAQAGDKAYLSPKDVNGKTWDQVALLDPPATTLVFPGKAVTLLVYIPESDSYRIFAGGKYGPPQNVPFELDERKESGVFARITLEHAKFETGEDDKEFLMNYQYGVLSIIPPPRIVADQDLSTNQKVKVSLSVTDPGRTPADIPGVTFVKSPDGSVPVKDPVILTKSVSRSRVPNGTGAPERVRGFMQYNSPPGAIAPPFSEFSGRNSVIGYHYLPDRNGATLAANYDGIPVLETFGEMTVTIANKSMPLVLDEIVTVLGKPGDTADALFTRWMKLTTQMDSTFTIYSITKPESPVFDITSDTYKCMFPEMALVGFFKPANWSQPVSWTNTQNYECPSGTALKGDMPAVVSSSCQGLLSPTGLAVPKAPKQRVAPVNPNTWGGG